MSDSLRPQDCSPSVSSVYGILQARVLEWLAIPFSRGSSWIRDRTWVFHITGRFFAIWTTREASLPAQFSLNLLDLGLDVTYSGRHFWTLWPESGPFTLLLRHLPPCWALTQDSSIFLKISLLCPWPPPKHGQHFLVELFGVAECSNLCCPTW